MDSKQATALAMCQMLLRQKQADASATLNHNDIDSAVAQVIGMLGYTDLDHEAMVRMLEERFTVYAPGHGTLGANDDHVAWLPGKRGSLAWRYWDRYKILLNERIPPAGVEGIDSVTDDVLQRLEDPERHGFWDRRGLVMGHVQSGKTASYCGLICKAADAGYKVIVVLSGIHNSLRSQTQIRMDEGFLGFMSEPMEQGHQQFRPAGVGNIDRSLLANTATNRTEKGDFNRTVANQFGIHPGGLPLLFVTKKNVSVLKNLNSWIYSCATTADPVSNRRFVPDVPVLVIDDEADLASIDTKLQTFDEDGNPDPDHDPTETNRQIRLLLRAFEKAAYVGYTATPFANIYIYDKGHTPALGDDLFPRSFLISIPPPSNYIGPARVFGVARDEDAGLQKVEPLPLVRTISDHAESDKVDEVRGWMPPRLVAKTAHEPRYMNRSVIPPSLREAILSFLLATAVRTIRRSSPLHNSMLIHVVRYTKVQSRVAVQVETALKEIVQRLRNGDGDHRPTIQEELKELWIRDWEPTNQACKQLVTEDTPELPEWEQILKVLISVAVSIKVKTINGSAGDVLDYQDHKDTGLNIIAIGGDKLSRGLTLEGLTISYFLRASRMYDTLMQMGRWFGYRDRYVDVCRLYTTKEILEWFVHVTAASEELQREFEHMVSVGGTPKDYGLKVRSHPAMLVTSAVKMRHGMEMQLSFSGDISETIIFARDAQWNARNLTASETWLGGLGKPLPDGSPQGGYTWVNVSAASVLNFLMSYTSHEDARRVETDLLAKYIRTQNNAKEKELVEWTVHLASSGLSDAVRRSIAGQTVGLIERAPFPAEQRSDRYTIRRLVNPADEVIDLTSDEIEKALKWTSERWEKEPSRHEPGSVPSKPGGIEIRKVRHKSKGLLLLYPLKPPSVLSMPDSIPIMGMAISFPASDTAKEITYTVNNVFTRRGGDDDSL